MRRVIQRCHVQASVDFTGSMRRGAVSGEFDLFDAGDWGSLNLLKQARLQRSSDSEFMSTRKVSTF